MLGSQMGRVTSRLIVELPHQLARQVHRVQLQALRLDPVLGRLPKTRHRRRWNALTS